MASWKLGPALAAGNSRGAQARRAVAADRAAPRPSSRSRRACRRACSTSCPASARPPARRSACTWTSTPSPSPARPRSASTSCEYAGKSNMKHVCARVRRQVAEHRAGRLRPISTRAARAAAGGIFFNQGEVCNAGSRLLVDETIKDEFLDKRDGARRRSCAPGDPLDPEDADGRDRRRAPARARARLHRGRQAGRRASSRWAARACAAETGGYYIEPTVFDGVDNKMRIAQEEIFGPVLAVIAFKDAAEARAHRQRHDLRPGRRACGRADLNTRAPDRARAARRHRVGQPLRRRRHHRAVRRLQAVAASAATSRCTRSTSTPSSRRPGSISDARSAHVAEHRVARADRRR